MTFVGIFLCAYDCKSVQVSPNTDQLKFSKFCPLLENVETYETQFYSPRKINMKIFSLILPLQLQSMIRKATL